MVSRTVKPVATSLLAATLVIATTIDATAFETSVSFCNRTPEGVYVAVGGDLQGTSEITTRGWYEVTPCTCSTVLDADLRATEIFVLATRAGLDNVLNDERAGLCVHPNDQFRYMFENTSPSRCEQAGGQWAMFKWYDTAQDPSFRVTLRRQGSCNLMDD
jgi:uncharacterized membrane protein